MGLGQKSVEKQALWTPVINKATGQPYTGLEQCASLERLEEEEKELSDLLDKELNKWMDANPEVNEKILQDFKQGFKFKHTDGYTYKIIQFKNGEHALSRSKFAGGASGFRKGGTAYIHLRTVSAKVARVEQIPGIIDAQESNDNFEIIQLQPDAKGDKFLLLNKKPYTPTVEGATNASEKTESKTESETETETETEESSVE